jgi:hypothetical protein
MNLQLFNSVSFEVASRRNARMPARVGAHRLRKALHRDRSRREHERRSRKKLFLMMEPARDRQTLNGQANRRPAKAGEKIDRARMFHFFLSPLERRIEQSGRLE